MAQGSVEVDGHADLILNVSPKGGGAAVFSASSRALARASPVFDRILYGDFAESKTKDTGDP